MLSRYQLPSIFIGVATALVIQASPSLALSPIEVNDVAQSVTVKIKGPNDTQGSGVIIKRQGTTYYVLTAKHVLTGSGTYEIIAPDGRQYAFDGSQANTSTQTDLALLQFTSEQSYRSADIGNSNDMTPGRTVYVAGYAGGSRNLRPEYQFTSGQVTARQEAIEGYDIVYTNVTQGGMSGGPVLDELGLLVGIHGLAETEVVNGTRIGLNLGIPINTFAELNPFLTSVSVSSQQVDELNTEGFSLLEQYEYESALNTFNIAVQLDSTSALAYVGRGLARKERADEVRSQQIDFEGNLDAGKTEEYFRAYQLAISDFGTAIELQPEPEVMAHAYVLRGRSKFVLGQTSEALRDYDTAIQVSPSFVPAYLEKCSIHSIYAAADNYQERYRIAIATCDNAKRLAEAQGLSNLSESIDRYVIRMESCRATDDPIGGAYRYVEGNQDVYFPAEFYGILLEQCLYWSSSNPIHPNELVQQYAIPY